MVMKRGGLNIQISPAINTRIHCVVTKIQTAKEIVKNHNAGRDHGINADGTSDRQEKCAAFTIFLGGKTTALGIPRMAGGTSQEYLDAHNSILSELAELSKAIRHLRLHLGCLHDG